ncbi:MAG TPA: 30S ribosomal protein S20 [Pirellulaceae bacterium]|nr:30S ribosomal protein S20 [Pirellulaceae bacterium]HMO92646.1 30S ribosomal protein S20 [Pirellulaceae bacterium]HMP70206.1 30S ribosomal protein S20 [Pirellulaceae bacterium]
MPNTKSAAKRLKQNVDRRSRNRSVKSELKTHVKKVASSVSSGDVPKAEEEYKVTAKRLDQASSKGVIHPNKSARLKSRLQKKIKTAKQSG